ncbi:MAG: hypothetical protein DI616_15980 [Paracoccus denitrificans]|uniref:N4 gp53-like protein n=1 Tax=Paracoccus denitrificans TaxID=266 RepID=A0A533I0K1_PARDE|nr:MAG: hypothetical protein DI616_15980 [Paracoccus denitrificans]
MGLFSSKKKIIVNVTVQPVFEEARIPYSVKAGVIKYVLGDITSMSDSINEELAGCVGTKANTGFSWAKREDYIPGVPTAYVKSNIDARSTVLGTIAVNVGQPVTAVYYRYGPMNSLHYAWTWIVNTHGYNAQTNELVGLSASTGFKCYLSNMVATYTRESYDFVRETYDEGVFAQLGPSPKSGWTPSKPYTYLAPGGIGEYAEQPAYEVSDVAVDDYVTITYEFEDAEGNYVQRGLTLAITGISDEDYHQVRYTKEDGKTGFFTYLHGAGYYPAIDLAYVMEYNDLGSYYPWAYFRVDGTPVHYDSEYYEMYKHCKKWCQYIGVDFERIYSAVHTDNDVDDVAQVILQVAVKPDSTNQAVIEYLFKHFSLLHENSLSQMQMADNLPDKFLAFSTSPSQAQRIMDRQFAQTLQFSGITRSRQAGVIGKKGTYTQHYGLVAQNSQLIESITPTGTETSTVWSSQPAYVYRYQVLDSVFEEIAVFGLRMDYHVHHKKGFGAGAGSPELLVPVDREVMRSISTARREQVICRGLYLLVNTVIVQKTPWYASGFFKAVLMIVATAVTIISMGTAWQSIVAAAAIGTYAAVITVTVLVLQYIVVTTAIRLFVKHFGPKLGLIAAVAAIAIGGYNSMAGGEGMWADGMLALGNNLVKESSNAYNLLTQDVYAEMLDFQEWAQGQFDSLKEKRDELGLNAQWQGLTGFDFVGMVPHTVFGESPSSYYARTVHSGNIGTNAYDLIENYHSYKLQLPQLSDTQEIIDGLQLPES